MKIKEKGSLGIFILFVRFVFPFAAPAQEVHVGADIVSQYIWRGTHCGNGGMQPDLTLQYKGFYVGAWGSAGFSGDVFELDLSVRYEKGGWKAGLTDYYATSKETPFPYFNYRTGKGHVFEGSVAYTFGQPFPLALNWNTYIAGTDNTYTKRDFSSYAEIAYSFSLWDIAMQTEIGITPWKGVYADRLQVVNIGLGAEKELPLTSRLAFSLFVKLIFNPADNKAFMVVGLSI